MFGVHPRDLQAPAVPTVARSHSGLDTTRSGMQCVRARNSGRQVTHLNGARIFRIVQQSDGAAVFPFKIPEAATHESAQHLPGESPALGLGPEQ